MSEAVESQTQNRDTRGDYAFRNVLKNKLRSAMGVKNPMVLMDPEKLEKDFGKVATADNIKTACEEMTTSHEFKTGTTKPPAAPTLPALTKKPSNVKSKPESSVKHKTSQKSNALENYNKRGVMISERERGDDEEGPTKYERVNPEAWERSLKQWKKLQPDIFDKKPGSGPVKGA